MSSIKISKISIVYVGVFCVLAFGCGLRNHSITPKLMNVLEADRTGLSFTNKLTPTPEFNLFSYMYYYNGGGVGAGDFNNDGLIDVFFSANQGDNKLFINKGNLRFEDQTKAAQIPQDGGWSTGVAVVDINNDGLLDIYICRVGNYKSLKNKNQLLVCQKIENGVPVYRDEAADYGLDFSGFSTQAVFFDYDLDGDLDMFLLNHSVNHDGNYMPRKLFLGTYDSLAGQKFYRNDLKVSADGKTITHFTDITKECGINGSRIGYGLGVAVDDINLDGWPDFYVGNDFHENDYLYINQKNGTFKEMSNEAIMHTSQFSMGVDVADITNDGYPEIISMDMLPYDPYIIRRSLAQDDYLVFQQKLSYGYSFQYARNNLQLNDRNGMFTEAAHYAGVYASDWSWAPLWIDFDNDGKKDLFISNGIPKRMNDIDYINFVSNDEMQLKLKEHRVGEKDMALIEKFPEIKIPNKIYLNQGDVRFRDIQDEVGNNKNTFSNGAVYADFDNDGDLDVIVNNIDEPALLYENLSTKDSIKTSATIKLSGDLKNRNAIGAKVIVFAGAEVRTYNNNPYKGFQSSMCIPFTIGLSNTKVDSAFLIWPDNTYQPVTLKAGTTQTITYASKLPRFNYGLITGFYKNNTLQIKDVTASSGINYVHKENNFNEFTREQLILKMNSTEGPALAVGDLNGDGLEDFFIGASKEGHNAVYIQKKDGKFMNVQQPAMLLDSMWENVSAIIADVNNDHFNDIIIASGGNEYYGKDKHLLPLLYLNDGKAHFTKKEDAFTNIYVTQSVVTANDFDGDGNVDLFIGGRAVPWEYGKLPQSFLLKNDGTGKFSDVTERYFKDSNSIAGMVTSAVWSDVNNDNIRDLVVSYDWGGIDAFVYHSGSFSKKVVTENKGWWNFIYPFDADSDGDIDFIAGNIGLNTPLNASPQTPLTMYYNDFDDNEKREQLITYFLGGSEIPFATKMELEKQMPSLKKKFLYAADFAKANPMDLFGKEKLNSSDKFVADYLGSVLIINNGNLNFSVKLLPFQAQLSSLKCASVVDANSDGLPDVLIGGNYHANNTAIGRLDGDFGGILINKGNGEFTYSYLNGLLLNGEIRNIQPINIKGSKAFLVAKNNDRLQLIQFSEIKK